MVIKSCKNFAKDIIFASLLTPLLNSTPDDKSTKLLYLKAFCILSSLMPPEIKNGVLPIAILKKYLKIDVTLLDYFVHLPITEKLLETNDLSAGDIKIIETDLFTYQTPTQYDLVLSCGLIEHFNDTADIINRHIAFLKPGGTLFITLPNFKAVNGWFQEKFDKENYDKHNVDCMDPKLLENICKEAGLQVIQSRYFGKFSVWLENENQKTAAVKLLKKIIWWVGKLLTKALPFDSKQLSPYIILEARKVN